MFLIRIGASSGHKVITSGDWTMYSGKVISMANDILVATDRHDRERTHTLAEDARLTCDGAICTAADFKPGMRIRVTTREGARDVAVGIEALVKNERFEK
jgi:hypothetical protein